MASSALELACALIAFDTSNPPGREGECAALLASRLEAGGLTARLIPQGEDRASVVADLPGMDATLPPLVFTGHLDTVPAGDRPWASPPHAPAVRDGLLYGRGACDMKAAVAAMSNAALAARSSRLRRGVRLIFTWGEETGCEGATALLSDLDAVGPAFALVIGEPTGNRLGVAHKGALALKGVVRGVASHSSMPERGVNAIYAAAQAVVRLQAATWDALADPVLGGCTLNVGLFAGGRNYNSVPDRAEFTVDMRTNGRLSHPHAQARLAGIVGEDVALEPLVDVPPLFTPTDHPVVQDALTLVPSMTGVSGGPIALPFFTDGARLAPRMEAPALIVGPGEPAVAHQTDEWCALDALAEAEAIYAGMIAHWCG